MPTIGKSMYPLKSSYQLLSSMKSRFDQLQVQLATGEKAATLAELGSDRYFDLATRARISRMDAYKDTQTTLDLRLSILNTTVTRLDQLESAQATSVVPGSYGTSNINFATSPAVSRARLDEVIDLLNADAGGRYLFGGGRTDKPPVAKVNDIMNGVAGRAGFKQVAAERTLADAGSNGLGRLNLTSAGSQVTLARDGTHPFGLQLSTLTTTSADIALTQPAGVPPQLGVGFGATPPLPGTSVTMGFVMPDGTEEAITLTAVASAPAGKGEFVVGAATAGAVTASVPSVATAAGTLTINGQNFAVNAGDDAMTVAAAINGNPLAGVTASVGTGANAGRLILTGDTLATDVNVTSTVAGLGIAAGNYPAMDAQEATTANFAAALSSSLNSLVATKGAAASTFAAADSFFNGHGEQVMRVDGPPYETATGLVAGTAANTVFWYTGEDSADPRASVNAKVDDGTNVNYGVQANEDGIRQLVKTLAAMSIQTYPVADDTSSQRFDAMASRQVSRLSPMHDSEPGSIETIGVDIALAAGTVDATRERQTAHRGQLESMLAGIETISKEDVAVEILALKTRLEASYATTALVSQLSLVNYLPK